MGVAYKPQQNHETTVVGEDLVSLMPNGLTRIHGRVGGAQEYIEFQSKEGVSYFTQRAGSDFPVYRSDRGAQRVIGGKIPGSLADGELMARELADAHMAQHTRK